MFGPIRMCVFFIRTLFLFSCVLQIFCCLGGEVYLVKMQIVPLSLNGQTST